MARAERKDLSHPDETKTDWCEAPHFEYYVAGRLHIRMADGTEFEAGPGEVTALPSGHDAWVAGDEPAAATRS